MANPQKENGYTPIAHELMGAILVYSFTAYGLRVLFYILAATYGRQRKKAQISYGGIAKNVRFSRRNVIRACRKMQDENVIFIQKSCGERSANIIGVKKDYQTWKYWPKEYLVDKSGNLVISKTLSGDVPDTMVVMPQTLSKGQSGDSPDTTLGVSSITTTKNTKEYTQESVRSKQLAFKEIAQIITGYEDWIKKNTAALVDRLYKHGFKDEAKIWAFIVQARGKRNPAGYLVNALANPQYVVGDSAYDQAKKEMRACGKY